MRARLAVCLLFSVLISGACGGRLVRGGSDEGGGATPASGGSLSDGATSSAGTTDQRGGRSGAGTTSSGGGCACPVLDCPPGYAAVPNADSCCFHCESVCNNVVCPGIACGSGSYLELLAGQCCPTCVQDCEAQRAGYQALRQALVERFSTLGCMTNDDCAVYYEKNQCSLGCGIAMHRDAILNLDSQLQAYAQTSCSPNCMYPVPPCEAVAPSCLRGLCANNAIPR